MKEGSHYSCLIVAKRCGMLADKDPERADLTRKDDMTQKTPLDIPQEEIIAFCNKWQVTEFALFGSALRDDFRPDSDVDVLVEFAPSAKRTLFHLMEMQDELEALFGRKVDLLTRRGVEQSRNPLRKRAILSTARVLYAA